MLRRHSSTLVGRGRHAASSAGIQHARSHRDFIAITISIAYAYRTREKRREPVIGSDVRACRSIRRSICGITAMASSSPRSHRPASSAGSRCLLMLIAILQPLQGMAAWSCACSHGPGAAWPTARYCSARMKNGLGTCSCCRNIRQHGSSASSCCNRPPDNSRPILRGESSAILALCSCRNEQSDVVVTIAPSAGIRFHELAAIPLQLAVWTSEFDAPQPPGAILKILHRPWALSSSERCVHLCRLTL